MIPNAEAMRTTALAIEAKLHEAGWDEPPVLLALASQPFGGDGTAIAIREVPFRDQIPSGNPAVYLRVMADQFGDGHMLSPIAELMAKPDFAGFAFACEGWMLKQKGKSLDDRARLERPIADTPGGIEVRNVTIVDAAGRITYASRERGKPPEVCCTGDGADDFQVGGGRVMAALRDMVLAVALRMPFGTADLDAIRGIDLRNARG